MPESLIVITAHSNNRLVRETIYKQLAKTILALIKNSLPYC